ncbi:MAG: FmdE family protein [Methanobacteriaceae archaeon]|nr:FmdE family protein [Methanobacteriaceae archaeon]
MKKQMFLILSVCMLVLMMVGSVAADDSSDGGVVNSSSIADDDQILGNDSDSNQNSAEPELIDPIIGVKVNYEYSDDVINPEIVVKDSTGANINFNKTIDPIFGHYIVSFLYLGANNGTKFNVSVSAPGYTTQTQQIAVYFNPNNSTDPNLYGNATFNMKATNNYKLGRTVTAIADSILNFASADQVLAITTAGVPKLNGVTSEDCIEGILNAAKGKITYGKGNLLMLRQTAVDTVDFAFIIKKGTTLKVVVFRNGSTTPIYNGTISENMTHTQWNTYVQKVGNENGYAFASLANAWAAGAHFNLLSAAAFHGHICDGTLGGYSITQALLKYYPPLQESGVGVGSPSDITSYKIIGVPGGSDDDAVMYFLDATPGKGAYIGFDTTNTGATTDILGIIRWD